MEQFRQLAMPGWAGVRREDLLHLLKELNRQIEQLDRAVKQAAEQHPRPVADDPAGSGASDALAFVLTIGECGPLAAASQLTSYLGLVPSETQLGQQAPSGSHYQARQLLSAQAAGGSSADHSAQG